MHSYCCCLFFTDSEFWISLAIVTVVSYIFLHTFLVELRVQHVIDEMFLLPCFVHAILDHNIIITPSLNSVVRFSDTFEKSKLIFSWISVINFLHNWIFLFRDRGHPMPWSHQGWLIAERFLFFYPGFFGMGWCY